MPLVPNAFDTPPFDEAVDRLRRFIASQGGSTELLWVFREDVTTCVRSCWIRMPAAADDTALARGCYEHARERGLGVTLSVLCDVRGRSASYVWSPKDEQEAERHMQPPSLKLSMGVGLDGGPISGLPVRSGIAWWCRCRLNSWRRCIREVSLPSRQECVRRACPAPTESVRQ